MMTGHDLLAALDTAFPGHCVRHFQFPFIRLEITSQKFKDSDEENRESIAAQSIQISASELRDLCNRLFIRLELLSPDESHPTIVDRGHFWLRSLAEPTPRPATDPLSSKVVHFYGYKGGQARSSVLCFLAQTLARDGWRVLAIDVDAEAPSLDVLFNVSAPDMASSLLGVRAGLPATPVRAVTPPSGSGYVDLLPFRPWETRFDLDAAALAMEGNIHPPGLTSLIAGVASISNKYDVLLVDHRTGLASTVPPWVSNLPGPVVVFARMDGQWRAARSHIQFLWNLQPEQPGLIVSFKPDEEPVELYKRRVLNQSTELLETLSGAMFVGSMTDNEAPTPENISDHWVLWPYDPAFNAVAAPSIEAVSGDVRASVLAVRRLLQLSTAPAHPQAQGPILRPSGAVDEGDLIQTQALRDLSAPNNPYTLIIGRKGTGKTRLLRALIDKGQGEALLVPNDDESNTGFSSNATELEELIVQTRRTPERFWWTLIRVALESESTERSGMTKSLKKIRDHAQTLQKAQRAASASKHRRVFLIDGLETAFPRADTFRFLAALFRVVASIDVSSAFNGKVRLRIFIRTDLAAGGFENLEQLSHGRTINLFWNTQAILNFALSRINNLDWFKSSFPSACQAIKDQRDRILEGALTSEECEHLLLMLFPEKLRRLNLNMTTFLRTYFSDDPMGRGSYYPRIYDEFLRVIASHKENEFEEAPLINDRVSEKLITFAHEKATDSFLNQVRAELRNLVDLKEEELGQLIESFRDEITPFSVSTLSARLARRTRLKQAKVRDALDQMKTLGIFEDRPGYRGQWRAGRLFKASLGMLYDRRKNRDETEPKS